VKKAVVKGRQPAPSLHQPGLGYQKSGIDTSARHGTLTPWRGL